MSVDRRRVNSIRRARSSFRAAMAHYVVTIGAFPRLRVQVVPPEAGDLKPSSDVAADGGYQDRQFLVTNLTERPAAPKMHQIPSNILLRNPIALSTCPPG